ncbi:hypothetical protein KR044_010235, partial [Drosophila immigrans]
TMRFIVILWGICVIFPDLTESGSFKVNKITCKCLDTSYCKFTKCEMKVVRRGVIAFNMECEVHQKPVTNLRVHFELFRKSNGYRSFMVNHTLDYCYYMRNPTSYPLFNAIHKSFIASTNFNHTCPFNHDFTVNDFIYSSNPLLDDLPVPNGEYMIVVRSASAKAWRMEHKVFVSRTD